MPLFLDDRPVIRRNLRKKLIAFKMLMNTREVNTVRKRQSDLVGLLSADHECFLYLSSLREFDCFVHGGNHVVIARIQIARAGNHHIPAIGEGMPELFHDGIKSFPSHDNNVSFCLLAKIFEIRREIPRQRVSDADDIIFIRGGYEREDHEMKLKMEN